MYVGWPSYVDNIVFVLKCKLFLVTLVYSTVLFHPLIRQPTRTQHARPNSSSNRQSIIVLVTVAKAVFTLSYMYGVHARRTGVRRTYMIV